MSIEITESYMVLNGRVMPSASLETLPESSSRTIYEVIRVISGVPLFLEKHMERLEASGRLLGCSLGAAADSIKVSIQDLIKANGSPDKNIKIIVYNLNNTTPDHMVYFIHSSYPSSWEYENGVHGTLLKEERSNPNAKIVNSSYKERVAEHLSRTKAYEALLVNSSSEITEGSRSNVFFVKNGTVITAPKSNVLIGITRVCVVDLCRKLNIEVLEKPVSLNLLREVDGVFMSGTSPKLLPISTIDDMSFGSADNPVIKSLMKGYDDMLNEYIAEKKRPV